MRSGTAAVLLLAATAPSGPAGSLPPRPAVIEEAPDLPADRLAIDPPIVWIDAPPGTSVQPELTVVSGAEPAVDLDLDVVPVVAGTDGAPEPLADAAEPAPSAVPWIALAERALHLEPDELARLWPTVTVPADADDTNTIAAIRVGSAPRGEVATLVLVDPGGETSIEASVDLERTGAAGAVVRVALSSDEVTSVRGTVTVRGWGRTIVDTPVPETVVLPGTVREQEIAFRAPAVPGPYEASVVLEPHGGGLVRASTDAVLWSPTATIVAVVLAVALVLWLGRRGLRSA